MKTLSQINWIAAIATAIIIASFIAYFLRKRCKEIIYLFSVFAGLVTILWFCPWLLASIVVTGIYLVFLILCLGFDSIKTPDDSLLKNERPRIVQMHYDTGDIWE